MNSETLQQKRQKMLRQQLELNVMKLEVRELELLEELEKLRENIAAQNAQLQEVIHNG